MRGAESPKQLETIVYPEFLGIGAQKAGTTWLHESLRLHPGIWLPPRKEIHYFDEKLDKSSLSVWRERLFGDHVADKQWRSQFKSRLKQHLKELSMFGDGREDLVWDARYFLGTPGPRWYASLFEQGNGRVTGEITPSYSVLSRQKVAQVYSLMPDAKLIFLMRNPIERIWSQSVMNFEKVIGSSVYSAPEATILKGIDRFGSRAFTDYLRTLDTWTEFYGEDRIFVGFMEDISRHPVDMMRCLYEFLSVDASVAENSAIRQKVHSRSQDTMPTRVASHIAQQFRENFVCLERRFGGYASFWAYCARKLVEDPPDHKGLSYPLYESVLWQNWIGKPEQSVAGNDETGLQSKVLSEFR